MKKKWQDVVKSKEDYDKLVSTGYGWVFHEDLPLSWEECLKELEGKNLNEIIIKVISTSWCSGCQSLKHSLEQNNIEYTLVDADDFSNQEYIAKLGVRSLPMTIIEIDGVVKGKIQGAVSITALRKAVDDIVKEMEGK